MTDEMRDKLHHMFSVVIQGGCTDDMLGILDRAVEDDYLTQDELDSVTETEVANLFDTYWFTCEQCGWTMPIDEMADDDTWRCQQCQAED